MGSARVEKDWQKKGLSTYDTQAILGTLAHYGVTVNEPSFVALAQSQYPLTIAQGWFEAWTGKGQFTSFPAAAAMELWARWQKGRLAPVEFAGPLTEWVFALAERAQGKPSPKLDECMARVEALRSQLPATPNGIVESFGAELFALLDDHGEDFEQIFDGLAQKLVEGNEPVLAEKFAELEEFLLPDRKGVVRAIVRAAKGEKAAAVADLESLLEQERPTEGAVLTAVDALLHLGALDEAQRNAERQLDKAEQAGSHHLALGLCERLAYLFDKREDLPAMRVLEKRARALAEAHDRAHPHHTHHH